jgi:hypothetical protein
VNITLPRLIPPDMDAKLEQYIGMIPEHCRQGLLDYLRYGVPPGHFLQAVLSNDLAEACGRADSTNQRALFEYVFVLYNYAPGAAWGSPEKVKAWIQRGLDVRREAAEGRP